MSILRRISLILKGYASATSDKVDQIAAEEELRAAKAKRQAAEELRKAVDAVAHAPSYTPPQPQATSTKLLADYQLLGLKTDADLQTVEEAWRKLALRADPKRFPEGSDEEKRAAEILRSINEAYARIRENLNPTEGRFGQLEL